MDGVIETWSWETYIWTYIPASGAHAWSQVNSSLQLDLLGPPLMHCRPHTQTQSYQEPSRLQLFPYLCNPPEKFCSCNSNGQFLLT